MVSPNINLSQSPSKNKNAEMLRILMPVIIIVLLIIVGNKIISGITGAISAPFEALGIKDTQQEKEDLQSAENKIRALERSKNNPFNPGYISVVMKQYPKVSILNASYADSLAKRIWDAIGRIYDSPEDIFSAIKACEAKTHVSYLANTFAKKYNKDLLTWLEQKMDTTEQKIILGKIIDYVNGLPTGGKNK